MAKKTKKKTKKRAKKKVALCPGRELRLRKTGDLDADTFRRLVARRARSVLGKPVAPIKKKRDRLKSEDEISKFFEKINLGADFLPASYLKKGAIRANAVCRIVTPSSLGTGSLIADGNYIMTNNHVLRRESVASASTAEFGYEAGGNPVRIALKPDRFFITDRDLDFAIVACDSGQLNDVEPIPLLRNPATVTRHEQVNIIQHPRGRPKEIAIHNNRVKRVMNRVLHYETDTEPGSSGSPVFNNEWKLVALHHAGWATGGGHATNEGIRMSAIVAHLLGRNERESGNREGLESILRTVPDTSPYLGFFDYHGLAEADELEIELPYFTGTRNCADVGFWNIEHFNNSVSQDRIQDVADVVNRMSLDVLGLVEVEAGALDRLVAELATRGDGVGYVYKDVRWSQDLAVLFDQDTSNVTLNEDIPRRHRRRLAQRTASGKTAFPRAPLFAHCSVSEGNRSPIEFIMIVVHLKAFGDAQSRARRRLAAKILREIIEDIRVTEQLPVVLGGDFNERLDTDVLNSLSTSPDLFSLTADDATTDAISYIGDSHRSLIDHIMVSNDVRTGDISGDDAAIVRLDRSIRDFSSSVSDHVPVVFRMRYRNRPTRIVEPPRPDLHTIPIPEGSATVEVGFR
jgi:endonuclease/exonuclease/phosphatase family metal-dependent hydrolase